MRLSTALFALCMLVPAVSSAQPIDLGPDVTGYRRFLLYPHLQKGWESMQRGERERALSEFEQARALAPDNPVVALHLAGAYRTFGDTPRAASVLRDQLTRTPNDARIRTALSDLLAPSPSATRGAPDRVTAGMQPGSAVPSATPAPATQRVRRTRQEPRVPIGPPSIDHRARFTDALYQGRLDDAHLDALTLLAADGDAATLDEVTYKLVQAGAARHAASVLLSAYPFPSGAPAQREILFDRLSMIVEQEHASLPVTDLTKLRVPLDTPELRSRQGLLWANLRDCKTVRTILGDRSDQYTYDDWMRLGDCAGTQEPLAARDAYARAHALLPGGAGSRILASTAYAAGDYRAAMDAWRSVGAEHLAANELLLSVAAALEAGDTGQAATWLQSYRQRGDVLSYQYWILEARASTASGDRAGTAAALEHAVDLHPEANDYLQLALLHDEPGQRLTYLERAAALDARNVHVQSALGYAYKSLERDIEALRAFELAAQLDPANVNVQLELGQAYWTAGRVHDAELALDQAWKADPGNLAAARLLVYVKQRLSRNVEARWYAERVIDALPFEDAAFAAEAAVPLADRRFGLQRLHEDLGRRVTVNLDGFSGTQVGTGMVAAQPGGHYSSYSQFDVEYRLGAQPVRSGTTVAMYVRVLADGGQERRAVPMENATIGAGVRWKPFRTQVLYFAAEHQTHLASQRREVLLRASMSLFNAGRFSDDWHPSGRGWMAQNLYLDAGRYIVNKQSALTADYRTGYHLKTGASQTLEPYVRAQVSGLQSDDFRRDIRSGLGVRWNLWHGASIYNAAPHKFSFGVEVQHAFETYLSDRRGLFVTVGSRW